MSEPKCMFVHTSAFLPRFLAAPFSNIPSLMLSSSVHLSVNPSLPSSLRLSLSLSPALSRSHHSLISSLLTSTRLISPLLTPPLPLLSCPFYFIHDRPGRPRFLILRKAAPSSRWSRTAATARFSPLFVSEGLRDGKMGEKWVIRGETGKGMRRRACCSSFAFTSA